ncbi:MAG: hypothetical protein P8X96_01040 [Desulfobacteraceae bacterium]|jgi:hypothetical protein
MSRFGAIALYLSVWLVIATGSVFGGATVPDSGDAVAPKAVFPKLKYDFGEVFEGVDVKYDFLIENQGDAPLVIKNIRPD